MADLTSRLQRWSPVIDLITSLAVVVSVVYLSLEVRQNTRAVKGTAFQELIHASDASMLAMATDSSLADIVVNGDFDGFEALSRSEQARYFSYTRVQMRNQENAFLQYRRGLISEEEWGVYNRITCYLVQRLGAAWSLHEPFFTPAFIDVVNACPRDGVTN